MEKANVINALGYCAAGSCEGCCYYGIEDCDSKMCKDAIALLKANETSAKPKYSFVWVYTKRTNMSEYLTDKVAYQRVASHEQYETMRNYYAKERDVQLIASFRWENRKLFCRIKCPINPLPVKGEFEVPSGNALRDFLKANGWTFKEQLYSNMFN